MDNIYVIAIVISMLYFFAKFIEMRFIIKESKPIKNIVRDSLLVCFSTIIGLFISHQLTPIKEVLSTTTTHAFTGSPDF